MRGQIPDHGLVLLLARDDRSGAAQQCNNSANANSVDICQHIKDKEVG